MVNLIRAGDEPDFSYEDVSKARVIAPSIAAALQNALLFSKMEHEKGILSSVAELSPRGIVVLDRELRPIYCNHKGKKFCLLLSGIQPEQADEVTAECLHIPSSLLRLCVSLKGQRERSVGFFCGLDTYPGNEKRFRIDCSLPWQYEQKAHLPYFLISIKEMDKICVDGEEMLKGKYHLTKREMDVVEYVAEGLSNKEIAQKLYISHFTVDSHLKKIFEKTGVRNRTELAANL